MDMYFSGKVYAKKLTVWKYLKMLNISGNIISQIWNTWRVKTAHFITIFFIIIAIFY